MKKLKERNKNKNFTKLTQKNGMSLILLIIIIIIAIIIVAGAVMRNYKNWKK